MRITWMGHSTVLIELDGARVLTDPMLRNRVAHLLRVAGPSEAAPGDLDAVLVSHLHYDHLDIPSLLGLGISTHVVVPAGGGKLLESRGFEHVTEVRVGEAVEVGGVTVRATEAAHEGRRNPFGAAAEAVGYLVEGSARAYFAGDTDVFPGMSAIGPGLDLALLPVAGWGYRVPAGHLDPRRAVEALGLLRPRVAVPIHWGTYRTGGLGRREALLREPAETFARLARELEPEVDVRVVPVGGSLELAGARA